MGDLSKDLISVVYSLLPGFVVGWVFYGLTPHPKATPFERIVQALIFTMFVKSVLVLLHAAGDSLGRYASILEWTADLELVLSVVVALVLGLSFSKLMNSGSLHALLSDRGFTRRTSFSSEWYSAFHREKRFIILHLVGQRRLHGWPEEWPDHPDRGQFLIMQPSWLLDDGSTAPLHGVERFLVQASHVEFVEFLKGGDELQVEDAELLRVENLLVEVQKGKKDGNKDPAATSGEPRPADQRI